MKNLQAFVIGFSLIPTFGLVFWLLLHVVGERWLGLAAGTGGANAGAVMAGLLFSGGCIVALIFLSEWVQ